MSRVVGALLLSGLSGLSTIIGFLIIFIRIKTNKLNKFISFCIAFSLSIMISISIFDLIPEAFKSLLDNYSLYKTLIIILISFIIGIFIVNIFIKKINKININDLYRLGIINMIIMIIHNLPEGILTFFSCYNNITIGLKITIAIMLHNIPEGISIAIPIYYATNSPKKAFKAVLISALSEPLGALLSFIILKRFITDIMIGIILIIVASIMIYLSIEEMYPKAIKYNECKEIIKGIILGVIIVILNILLI